PITFLPDQSMTLTGTLSDRTGMPISKGNLRLTVPYTRTGVEILSSPSGIFTFQNLNIPDSSEVVISAKHNPNGNKPFIILDGQPAPQLTKNPYQPAEVTNIDSTMSAYLNNSKRQYSYLRQLKEVKIEGAKAKRPSHADHPALSGLSSISGTLIEGERFKGC